MSEFDPSTELTESDLKKYPGGVTIHFGLTNNGKLYLHRRGYSYWVCEQVMKQGEVLADTVMRLEAHLAADGIHMRSMVAPRVFVVRREVSSMRVLVHIECVPVASRLKFEPFSSGLLLEGLIGDHPMINDLNLLVETSALSLQQRSLQAA